MSKITMDTFEEQEGKSKLSVIFIITFDSSKPRQWRLFFFAQL